jgi:hypothetical protein
MKKYLASVSKMKEIPLTQGQVALVDDEDYERISAHPWYARLDPDTRSYYALRNMTFEGKRVTQRMHREVMGLGYGDPLKVDHRVSGNTLDNRKSNLRLANDQQNTHNARRRKDNTSGFKGVHFIKGWKYRARIQVNGKRIVLGDRATPEAAYELYVAAARELHGEFANDGKGQNAEAIIGR